jgi:mycobactin peptide synthetase MbtE
MAAVGSYYAQPTPLTVAHVEQHTTARTRTATALAGPGEPPSTDTERALAAMLVELLGVAGVSRRDDFFSLGGDSIMAVRLAARARDAGIDLTPRMVFQHPVVADLAAVLDDAENDVAPTDIHHAPMTASGLSADELAELMSSWPASQNGAP